MRLRLLLPVVFCLLGASSPGLCAPAEYERTQKAIGIVASQHAAAARARLAQMKPAERADLANALAWWDESALDLDLRRGDRGQVTHLAARFLELDIAPTLQPAPTEERAAAFLKAGALGFDLLALCSTDTLLLSGIDRNAAARIFVFEQRYQGYPVRGAQAFVELDARGRLTRLDSSLVPCVKATTDAKVPRGQAVKTAGDDLVTRQEPLWTNVKPHLADAALVVVNDRLAWQIWFTAPPNRIGGHREVLVDARDGHVFASIEHASFLDVNDRLFEVAGTIGISAISTVSLLWTGDRPCPAPTDPPLGADVFARDVDEAKASLCAAEQFFREVGTPLGRPDFGDWVDRSSGRRFVLGVGATPGISIGVNTTITVGGDRVPGLAFALGTARAESIGHEIGHSLNPRALATDPPAPLDPSRRGSDAEADGIEEHRSDVLGKLLAQRMPRRADDRCLLASDPDAMAAIAIQEHPTRPCSALHRIAPWRSFCEPRRDNGGWCEGTERTLDLVYGPYDAYSRSTATSLDHHVKGHTNLGVGNRAVAALMRDPSEPPSRFDGYSIPGLGASAIETLYLRSVAIGGEDDWAGYAASWRAAATSAFGSTAVSAQEHAVRTAHAAASIWSEPKSETVTTSTASVSVLRSPAAEFRPATASLILPSGVERTFVFYRPERASQRIEYVWRDEVRGAEFADTPGPFSGPCVLDGALTDFSPAAAGRDDALFVVWSEPTMSGGPGRLRGLRLPSPDVSLDGSCIRGWAAMEPGAERLLRGSPAIVVWEPTRIGIDCGVLESTFGPIFPFRTAGAMGLKIGDCFEVIERMPPIQPPFLLPPRIGPELWEALGPILDSKDGRGIPSPADRRGPGRDFAQSLVQHNIDLLPLLATQPSAQKTLTQLEAGVGKLFADALGSAGRASSVGARFSLLHQPELATAPDVGTARKILMDFRDRRLIVAFRDSAGALRIVDYDDVRSTDGPDPIPTLDSSPNATDPALATVAGTVSDHGEPVPARLLYAIYGTSETVGGVSVPTRLSYRVATTVAPGAPLTNASFMPARRIDTLTATRGVRRKVDYASARTRRAPVAVGSGERLHLFVAALTAGDLGPDPANTREITTGDRMRYAQLRPIPRRDGELTWVSERPTILADSDVFDDGSFFRTAEAGAALVTQQRGVLRFYFPDKLALTSRSLAP